MAYFRNFDVATCFDDLARHELERSGLVDSIRVSKARMGAFADPRFRHLRLLAYQAYKLTAQVEFTNGRYYIVSFITPTVVEMLAYKTHVLVEKIEDDRHKYPSLAPWNGTRKKKGERLILESHLINAHLRDNPQADPRVSAEFFEGLGETIKTPALYGALALGFYDYVIDFIKIGNIDSAFQCIYRAQDLINEGNQIRAEASTLNYSRTRTTGVAKAGGEARARKYKVLEQETIRLYLNGVWDSVPSAAQAIVPKIVALSKNGNGDLLPTTTKPLQWIRAYNRLKK